MTSTEMAQFYADSDFDGLFISELQGNRLYQLAERERLVSVSGQREAAGTLANGDTWKLTRVVSNLSYWWFQVLPVEKESVLA